MRSIWKGSLSFGLVNVPVKLYSATESHDISFHQVHNKDGGRIRYERKCEKCKKVIGYEDIDKGFNSEDGETVILDQSDFQTLPQEKSNEIEVMEFVPTEQIDPILFDKSYFLEPDSKSPKAYVLLRETLLATERTAIVKFALRQRTSLAALRVKDKVLVIQTLLWGDELRVPEFPALETDVKLQKRELDMSSSLVDSFASDFALDEYNDDYQVQLRELIDAKLEGGEAISTEDTEEDTGDAEVLDLMAALERSVKAAKSKNDGAKASEAASEDDSGDADDAEDEEDSKTSTTKAKSTRTTRKAPAKSTTAKSAPAKKPAARKSKSA